MRPSIRPLLLCYIFMAIICACEELPENPDPEISVTPSLYSINGHVQKGPFNLGTSIMIQSLDEDLNPTGKIYNTKTTNDAGTFGIENQIESRYIEIIASGYYFNEVSGKVSEAPMTLRALSDLNERGTTNVNLLTALESDRVRFLAVEQNLSLNDARKQAEEELFRLFNIPDQVSSAEGFDKMNIAEGGSQNAILLAISASLQSQRSTGELHELVSKIALDLADNGKVDDELIRKQIIAGGMLVDADEVRNNLESRYRSLGVGDYEIPPFEDYLDINGNGVIDKNDTWLILSQKDFLLSDVGGEISVQVQHNIDYEITIEDGGDEWITPIQTKAYIQEDVLSFEISQNNLYDQRFARIYIKDKNSDVSEYITVSQKQKDAITITADKFEIGKEGGVIEIDIKANVDYNVEIAEYCKSWIRQKPNIDTRGLVTNKLSFEVVPSDEAQKREGQIFIKGETLSETIRIYQAGERVLVLSDKELPVSCSGGVVSVDVTSNVEYEIVMPNVSWLREVALTKAMITSTRSFEVDQNDSYDNRSAVIVFKDLVSGKEENVTINQMQKDAIIVANDRYDISDYGGILDLEIQSNVDFDILISEEDVDWLSIAETRSLTSQILSIAVAPNTNYDERIGTVTIIGENSDISQVVTITQGFKKAILPVQSRYEVGAEGGTVTIEIQSNASVDVSDPWVSWIHRVETRALDSRYYVYTIDKNESTSPRECSILFNDAESWECSAEVVIWQAEKGSIELDTDSYKVPYDESVLEIEVMSNVDYQVRIPSDCDWITLAPEAKGLTASTVSLLIKKNTAFEERESTIDLYDPSSDILRTVTVTQEKNMDVVVVNVEVPGTLPDIVDYEQLRNIPNLKVTGTLNSRDEDLFNAYKWNTIELDLSEAYIEDETLNFGRPTGGNGQTIGQAARNVNFPNLQKVRLPRNIKTLGSNAFSNAFPMLREVDFGEDSKLEKILGGAAVTTIGMGGTYITGAFRNCDSLESIEIPASVTSIEGGAFWGCDNLKSITFASGSKMNRIEGKENKVTYTGSLGMSETATVFAGFLSGCPAMESFEVPANITEIGEGAFDGSSFIHIVIPETVRLIEPKNLFQGSSQLESVSLPSSFTEIGEGMFAGCISLKRVSFPSDEYKSIPASAFKNCSQLENIPYENAESLGDYALSGCSQITAIDLSNITSLGKYALEKTGLTSISIPDNITDLQEGLFRQCSSLSEVDLNSVVRIRKEAFFGTAVKSITVPSTMEKISRDAFASCTDLKEFVLTGGNLGLNQIFGYVSDNTGTYIPKIVIPKEMTSISTFVDDDDTSSGGMFGSHVGSLEFEDGCQLSSFGGAGYMEIVSIELPESIKVLEEGAFRGCKKLRTVALKSVEKIGASAFASCAMLENVDFSSSLITIDESAFAYCSALKKVELPSALSNIGTSAFSNTGLQCITIPSSVVSMGERVFDGCSEIEELTLEDGLTVLGENLFGYYPVSTKLTHVTIPSSLETWSGAFGSHKYLKSVTFADGVKSIPSYAFSGCTGLTELNFNNSLTEIGRAAFSGCTGLSELSFKEGLVSIKQSAFEGCDALSMVTLPSSLQLLESSVFKYCDNLQPFVINGSELSFSDCLPEHHTELVFGKDITKLSVESVGKNIKMVRFEDGAICQEITGSGFYSNKYIEQIKLPESLVSVSDYLFQNMQALKKVNVPRNLTSIGKLMFNNCKALTEVELEEGLTCLGSSMFSGCTTLSKISLPASLANVRGNVFENCTALTDVTFEEGYTVIGDYMFKGCTSLKEIVLPASLTNVGRNVFENCTALTDVTFEEGYTIIGDYMFKGCTSLSSVTLPSSLTRIGVQAFYTCESLQPFMINGSELEYGNNCLPSHHTELIFGKNITKMTFSDRLSNTITSVKFEEGSRCREIIGYPFSSRKNLTCVELPESLTAIGDEMFQSCTGLTEIEIPEAVTSIGQNAFLGCSGLIHVNIPDNVLTISYGAFRNCTGLTEVKIPCGITTLGKFVFDGCTGLRDVTLEDGLSSIGDHMFSNCTGLTEIVIPVSVTEIGDYAFYRATSLASIYCKPLTPPTVGSYTFSGVSSEVQKIYVPSSSLKLYQDEFGMTLKDRIVGYEY